MPSQNGSTMSLQGAWQTAGSASRFLGAIVGGYVFAYGFTAFATLAGFWLGLEFEESWTLAFMLGLLVYLTALLWAFTPRRTLVVWLVLGGGGVAMSVAAWFLSRLTIE